MRVKENRVRKSDQAFQKVLVAFEQAMSQAFQPLGFVFEQGDNSFCRYIFAGNPDIGISCKVDFEMDNSFPSYERYQLVYEDRVTQTEEMWVGGNIDEMCNDLKDLLYVFSSDSGRGDFPATTSTIGNESEEIYESKKSLKESYVVYGKAMNGRTVYWNKFEGWMVHDYDATKYETMESAMNAQFGIEDALPTVEAVYPIDIKKYESKKKPSKKNLKEHRDYPKRQAEEEDDENRKKWDDFDGVIKDVSEILGDKATFREDLSGEKGVWEVKGQDNIFVVINSYGFDGNMEQMWTVWIEDPTRIKDFNVFGDEFGRSAGEEGDWGCLSVYQQNCLDGGGFSYDEFLDDVRDIVENNFWVDEFGWWNEENQGDEE